MASPGERLKYFIENKGFTVKNFCDENKLDYAGMNKIVRNVNGLGVKVLAQVREILPDLDADWILFGTERKNVVKNYDIDQDEIPDHFEDLFLTYLSKPKSIHIMKEQVKEVLMQLGDGPDALHITPGDENSPLMDKLSKMAEQHSKKRDGK